jgi:hypothetical protein
MSKRKFFIYLLFFLIIFSVAFRSLIFNFVTNLIDWRDYALVAWLVFQNVQKIIHLDFINFFTTNAFYPNTNTLFFADTFLPQSIITLPFSLISKNPIFIFNFVFVITFILNYISSYLVFYKTLKREFLSFLASLFLIFSPFFYLELGHFQMMSYWPGLFCLYFILKNDEQNKIRNLILAGIFLSLQFLAGVYLSFFFVAIIFSFFLAKIIFERNLVKNLKQIIIVFVTFILLSGPFIYGYRSVQKQYSFERDATEFINYSAHLSDYLFTKPADSLLYKLDLIKKWNSFNKNFTGGRAAFPGFTLTVLSLLSLFKIYKENRLIKVKIELNEQKFFFLILVLVGLTFSLGPRLNFNGNYAHIPLPYWILLKTIPFLESIRALCRWSFVFYLGIVGLAFEYLKEKKNAILLGTIFILFFLECFPLNVRTYKDTYLDEKTEILKNICQKNKKVVLEVPITHFDGTGGIVDGLTYITKVELASSYHNCYLINGYSGYDLPSLLKFKDDFYQTLATKNSDKLVSFLKQNKVDILQVNRGRLDEESLANYEKIYQRLLKTKDIKLIGPDIFSF